MPVTVRIVPIPEPVKVTIKPKSPPPTVTLELDIRKSLSGDLMIFDHNDLDIVLSGKDKKITAFPKQTMTDFTYGAQNRLFAHLARKGIVMPESIQGGSYYGAMEAQLQEVADGKLNAAKFALVSIERFIKEEKPYYDNVETIVAGVEDEYTDPDKTDSTELGEVPQRDEQGSIRPGYGRGSSYTMSYMYTI
tara:strand:+ start:1253 stop:1828 length:576 start_codon:yes stop_codon:yes gene_type:complete